MVTRKEIVDDIYKYKDFQDRFKAEYVQLETRIIKLEVMLKNYKDGTLSFTPTNPISLLELQLRYMKDYLTILKSRAMIENIELKDIG